jgi:hypothetical protein
MDRWSSTAAALGAAIVLGAPGAAAQGPVTIAHDDVACIVAERHPQVDACFTPAASVGRAQAVFRAEGTDAWYAVDLKPEGPCFRGLLPRPLRTTRAIQYYVDVVDRAFAESRLPDRAPDVAYTARVVADEGACAAGRLAGFASRVTQPIVVTALRGGQVAATAMGAPIAGFSAEGIVVAPAAAGAGAPAGEAASAGGRAGGIGSKTLLIAGGAVAAAGLVAVAAGGGDDGDGGSGGGGNGGGTGGGGGGGGGGTVNLTGRWSGPWTYTLSTPGVPTVTCTSTITMDIQHSGSTVNATGTSGPSQCTGTGPGGPGGFAGGGSGTLSGTAANGTITWALPFLEGCPPLVHTGTYTANAMAGTVNGTCTLSGLPLTWTGNWALNRL